MHAVKGETRFLEVLVFPWHEANGCKPTKSRAKGRFNYDQSEPLNSVTSCTGFHRFHVVSFRYRSRVLLPRNHLPYYGSYCSIERWANKSN